jgi:asparagine synthase (glutamine-hydrolysing)
MRRARKGQSWTRLAGLSADRRYVDTMTIFDAPMRSELLGNGVADQDALLLDVLAQGPKDRMDRMMRADLLTYLPEDVLVKVDRATMASSLEARAPFLDHQVVEFAASLPARRKLRFHTAKVLLREIARELLPAALVDQPKGGFSVPLSSWFMGDLATTYRETVLAPDARLQDHLDSRLPARLLAEHGVQGADHAHRLWTLLVFELWARRWLCP